MAADESGGSIAGAQSSMRARKSAANRSREWTEFTRFLFLRLVFRYSREPKFNVKQPLGKSAVASVKECGIIRKYGLENQNEHQ